MTYLLLAVALLVIVGVTGTLVLWRRKGEVVVQKEVQPKEEGYDESSVGGLVRALAPVDEEAQEEDVTVADVRIGDAPHDVTDGGFLVDLHDGTFVTLWLHRENGVQQVAYLKGREHSGRYVNYGEVLDGEVFVGAEYSEVDALVNGARGLFSEGHVEAHERYLTDCAKWASATGCCGRCGHPLSSATSVWRGLGADCASKAGTWRLC
jgi:hypothetical protein